MARVYSYYPSSPSFQLYPRHSGPSTSLNPQGERAPSTLAQASGASRHRCSSRSCRTSCSLSRHPILFGKPIKAPRRLSSVWSRGEIFRAQRRTGHAATGAREQHLSQRARRVSRSCGIPYKVSIRRIHSPGHLQAASYSDGSDMAPPGLTRHPTTRRQEPKRARPTTATAKTTTAAK